MIERGDSIRV